MELQTSLLQPPDVWQIFRHILRDIGVKHEESCKAWVDFFAHVLVFLQDWVRAYATTMPKWQHVWHATNLFCAFFAFPEELTQRQSHCLHLILAHLDNAEVSFPFFLFYACHFDSKAGFFFF